MKIGPGQLEYFRKEPTRSSLSLISRRERSPDGLDVTVIIPAMNEEESIFSVVSRVHRVMKEVNISYEILVVDDGSTDLTGEAAKTAGARVIHHPYTIGNGAAVKTGIRHALGRNLVMLDADGQHSPEDILRLLEGLKEYDMVVGARTRESETHFHRRLANGIYNAFASYVCRRKIEDLTSGFRAMSAHIAREFVPLLPNSFSYPTTITLATIRSGYSLKYEPIVTARRHKNSKSKIKLFKDGSRFFLILFKITTLFSPLKIFLPISLITFLTGLGYGLYKVFVLDGRYGPTAAMLMVIAVLMFLIGLVSEQVAQLKFDRSDHWMDKGE